MIIIKNAVKTEEEKILGYEEQIQQINFGISFGIHNVSG
jgi:hypothetical protein